MKLGIQQSIFNMMFFNKTNICLITHHVYILNVYKLAKNLKYF